jgi:hypothetical protein
VSPAANNGLALLHLFDYCVPPVKLDLAVEQRPSHHTAQHQHDSFIYAWLPASTAKIHVAGINSILVGYDDDKLEVVTALNVYVQISDANGNLIRTKYFPLMGLVAKLVSNSGDKHQETTLATIDLATVEQQHLSTALNDQDREFTAVYVLSALKKPGLVSIQFEAQSDGYVNHASSKGTTVIKSQTREIQIFTPLRVQPKYIELVRDAYYQVTLSGGPSSADSAIKYEVAPSGAGPSKAASRHDTIVDVDVQRGMVRGRELGEVRVTVKAVGSACPPFVSSTVDAATTLLGGRCHAENRVQRVYSADHFVVKVVELRSVSVQAPLRSIKRGNEMPVYVMGNERTLSPLNFASAGYLKYTWKVNDHQVGALHHPLLRGATRKNDAESEQEDSHAQLDVGAYSLRFTARRAGIVKVSVRVEFTNKYNKLVVLTDTMDILVFDNPYFTHFQLPYYTFKYPQLRRPACSSSPSSGKNEFLEHHPTNQILMSPGSEFQVKTNYDKIASKITYKLRFYDQFGLNDADGQLQQQSSYCGNNTIQVS